VVSVNIHFDSSDTESPQHTAALTSGGVPVFCTRRSTTGLLSADLGERSNERRGRAFWAADGGELGSDLKGPPLLRECGVDGMPTLLLLDPPVVEGR
jgi:hypothetical protein